MVFHFEILNMYGSFLYYTLPGHFKGPIGRPIPKLQTDDMFRCSGTYGNPYLGCNATHIRVMLKIRIHYLFYLQISSVYYEYIRFLVLQTENICPYSLIHDLNSIKFNTHYYFNIQVDFINFITKYVLV